MIEAEIWKMGTLVGKFYYHDGQIQWDPDLQGGKDIVEHYQEMGYEGDDLIELLKEHIRGRWHIAFHDQEDLT